MRDRVCLAQLLYGKEYAFISTFDVRCFKPPLYFEIVTDGNTSGYICFATYSDITTYGNITIYLCCLD